uniref:G-protein coupled receptors family 1 profile domain-containing protein n=1 Tax=Salmo trutta TaxID=8032 RepID=A0A674CSX5_SALTR
GTSCMESSQVLRREQHILIMVLSMVSCYLLCWMPYGVMALVATFGRSGLVTPVASVVPTVLAKSSTVINPVIYVLFNNQVRGGARGQTRGTMVFTCRIAFTAVGCRLYSLLRQPSIASWHVRPEIQAQTAFQSSVFLTG